MEYTSNEFQEDKRIAIFVITKKYNSLFKTFTQSDDVQDCIQLCVIELWKARPKFDPKREKYVNFAVTICKRVMWRFLATRTSSNRKNYYHHSLDAPMPDGNRTEHDRVGQFDEDPIEKNYRAAFIQNALKTLLPYRREIIKPIVRLTLQGYMQTEISEIIGMHRESVASWLRVFKKHCDKNAQDIEAMEHSKPKSRKLQQEWQKLSIDRLCQNADDYTKIFGEKPNIYNVDVQYFKRLLIDFLNTYRKARPRVYKVISMYLQGYKHSEIVRQLNISNQNGTRILIAMRNYLHQWLEQDNYFSTLEQ